MIELGWTITDDQIVLPMVDTRKYKLEEGSIVKMAWHHGINNPYPWSSEHPVEVKILKNYDAWILCEVLPHDDCTTPYRTTLTKCEIFNDIARVWRKNEDGKYVREQVWPERYNYFDDEDIDGLFGCSTEEY